MAWILALWCLALLFVGGLVTTYRVGMAVPDWPTTFGRNMFTYPLDEMLSNFGVTVEHSHRLVASGLGLISILTVVLVFAMRERAGLRKLSVGVLAAIVAQGLLGGSRVLENDQRLAFLHGASAQLVYGLVAAFFVLTTRAWSTLETRPCKQARGLRRLAVLTLVLVYCQIVLGAWLRHSGATIALALHVFGAVASFFLVLALAKKLFATFDEGAAGGHERGPLRSTARWLVSCLLGQMALGLLSVFAIYGVSGGFAARPSMFEVVSATSHVAVGALLLGGCVAAVLFSRRTVRVTAVAKQPAAAVQPGLGLTA
ncbi:MAG: cytochrome c oxidase assembly protein subunit 15 [Chlamydiales bacterium]|jgi:cytochrome c oxidase assembly protein subunit 15